MRVGRNRGIHVLLACQQLTVGRRLADNATTRIALRTVTEQCSWDVIGSTEAAYLPHTPGPGLYVGAPGESPIRFQSLTAPRPMVLSTADQLFAA
jgi:S-DNA-T family DNA segregation ATPase FtsK/SpoIIIE